jgi:cellulose synthase/poly-beta-1,6-N-acetylglucosamine synthase-like glycosyltransferase
MQEINIGESELELSSDTGSDADMLREAASKPPLISVIVPCRNEARFISKCLESILASEYGRLNAEILVVDGMSDDGTREILDRYASRHGSIKRLDNPGQTTPAALNVGLVHAKGRLIVRMDAHVVYPPSYLSSLVRSLEKSGADNVGGVCVTIPADDTSKSQAIALALSSPFGVGNSYFRIGVSEPRWVDTVPFGCYRREIFDQIGLFDEELVRNQDDEFNLRLIRHGGRILLDPSIVSYYYGRDSVGKLWRMYYQYGRFKPLVCKKLGAVGTFRQLAPTALVASLLASGLLAIHRRWMLDVFLLIAAVYTLADLCVSLRLVAGRETRSLPWLVVVFPVLHFAYGLGYLVGIVRLFGRKRKRAPVDLRISR